MYFESEIERIKTIVLKTYEKKKRHTKNTNPEVFEEEEKSEFEYYEKYYGEKIDLLSSIEKSIEEYQLEPPKKKITPDSVKDATITVTYTDISFVLAEIRRQYENQINVQAEK